MAEALTLAMLGGLSPSTSGVPITAEERKNAVAEIRKSLNTEGLGAYDIGERLLGFIGESLITPVASIVEEAWSQRKELRDLAQKGEKHDVEGKVTLVEHAISCMVHPTVELRVFGKRIGAMLSA